MARILVNVGCGFSTGGSWRNFDASPTLRFERIPIVGRLYTKNAERFPDDARYGDITKRPLCAASEADAIFCSHMLEHVSRHSMRTALRHIYFMLKPGGVFRLIVPDLRQRAKAYAEGTIDADMFMEATGLGLEAMQGAGGRLRALFGNARHQWMYDEASMRNELQSAGFTAIRTCVLGDSGIEEFSEVEMIGRFIDGENGWTELALECRK